MNRKIYLYWKDEKKYEVVSDATISEEYSETLDSASVVLPSLSGADEMVFGAKPYDEVYLSIINADNDEEYGSRFLIDSVDSTQTSFTGKGRYDVTLQLMSETKRLEKVQLPNKAFTHSKVCGAKTIYEAIEYLVKTYSPRYVSENGLTSLFSIDESSDWTRFKATPCADVTMSKPTLRQALTTLFTQVGCIPVVKNRKITYLDLGATRTRFLINRKSPTAMASIRMGMSSDSWVNSLVSESSQSIDYDSSCVIEQLCFRDRDNVLLKQTENLKLETRYPIYEVKKLVLNAYVKGTARFNYSYLASGTGIFSGIGGCGTNMTYGDLAGCLNVSFTTSATSSAVKITPWCQSESDYIDASGTMTFNLTLAKVNSDKSLTALKTKQVTAYVNFSGAKQRDTSTWTAVITKAFDASDYTGNEITLAAFTFDGTIKVNGHVWEATEMHPNFGFATDSFPTSNVTWNVYSSYFATSEFVAGDWDDKLNPFVFKVNDTTENGFRSYFDITPLCVESSKRAQLEVDYTQMPEWSDVETMSKYFYATVGYAVGGTSIEGFSATYSISKGFWSKKYTYIENIINSLGINQQGVSHFYADVIPEKYWKYMFDTQTLYNPFFDTDDNNFAMLSFDIEYVPMIQAKTSYEKADVPLLLEQLDSAESGVSSMDAVSASEIEKADRLGNSAWTIHARVNSLSELPALNSAWNGRVAFKRTLKFGANAIDAEYALAENYVLKNYFTSIITKYRAYEYVDYSQSVERRELMRGYIRISNSGKGNSLNAWADSKTGPWIGTSSFSLARGLTGVLEGYCDSSKRLTGVGYWDSYVTDCELSAVCAGNSVVFTMKEYDNASDGPYVDGTFLTASGEYSTAAIGGVPQKWYESRGTSVPYIKLHSQNTILRDLKWGEDPKTFVRDSVRLVQQYPRFPKGSYPFAWDEDYTLKFPFDEKDIAELMSYSLQATACWAGSTFEDKSKARFSKWLFRFSPLVGGYPSENSYLAVMPSSDTSLTWTGAKRKFVFTDNLQQISYFWEYASDADYDMAVSDVIGAYNVKTAIEVCVVDLDDEQVYPVAWFKKGVFTTDSSTLKATLALTPVKSDKTLKESETHSLLYESE